MNTKIILYEILKYFTFALIITIILRMLPNIHMSNNDIYITSVIIVLIYLFIDNLLKVVYPIKDTTKCDPFENTHDESPIKFIPVKQELTDDDDYEKAQEYEYQNELDDNKEYDEQESPETHEHEEYDVFDPDDYKGILNPESSPAKIESNNNVEKTQDKLNIKDLVDNIKSQMPNKNINISINISGEEEDYMYTSSAVDNKTMSGKYENNGRKVLFRGTSSEHPQIAHMEQQAKQIKKSMQEYDQSTYVMKKPIRSENIDKCKKQYEYSCDDDNDLIYSDYNHVPLAENYKSTDFEYGYSFLPPEKWYPQPPFPPVCVSNRRDTILPSNTTGVPLDVKEWKDSLRITQPDTIKTSYITNKLNSCY